MARILVAGGLHTEDADAALGKARESFAAALGREIVIRGHVLLGGCRSTLDAVVANGASAAAIAAKLNPRVVIRSWVTKSTTPSHDVGEIVRSRVDDWRQVPRRYLYPESVQEADVVIIVGGRDGTHYAASWARLANKPIVPVAAFGLAAAEIFEDEVANFDRRPTGRITLEEFEILNRMLQVLDADTLSTFARDVVTLAERLITPTDVFVIMSFAEKGDLKDAYNTFLRVCKTAGFIAYKIDHHFDRSQRIVPAVMNAIRRSAFIISDLSEPSMNVYYEVGYAQALGKDVIATAREGTRLPFDLFDIPTIFWDSQDTLETKLKLEIGRLAPRFGREIVGATS
jgi:hypothetical protein